MPHPILFLGALWGPVVFLWITRMIRVISDGHARESKEALEVVKTDLKALNADVQVEQEEYDEVMAIKPMFLVEDYR